MKIQDIHSQPLIEVGILSRNSIHFVLLSTYKLIGYQKDNPYRMEYYSLPKGSYSCAYEDGMIRFQNNLFASLNFEPESDSERFILNNVRIGIEFHWEQEMQQCFEGALLIKTENHRLLAINRIALERYLYSVIASEMNARAHTEFLKAHAVISRSWLLAQLGTNTQTAQIGPAAPETTQKARLPRKTGLTARLNVFAGTSAKHILNSMFAPTIIANVIKAFWKSILHR